MSFRDELVLLRTNMHCMFACLAKLVEMEEGNRSNILIPLVAIDGALGDIDNCIETIFCAIDQDEKDELRLKCCPFCSSLNITAIPNSSGWCVECDSCHAEGPLCETRDDAESEWNRCGR